MRRIERKVVGHGGLVEDKGISESGKHAFVGRRYVAAEAVDTLDCWTRNNRIRDLGRCACGHRNSGNHGVPPKIARAVECHRRRHQWVVGALAREDGQATVEFAVIAAGFMAVTVALTVMWKAFGGGMLVEHALAVASHHIQAVAPVTIVDIFLY